MAITITITISTIKGSSSTRTRIMVAITNLETTDIIKETININKMATR